MDTDLFLNNVPKLIEIEFIDLNTLTELCFLEFGRRHGYRRQVPVPELHCKPVALPELSHALLLVPVALPVRRGQH